MNAERKLRCWDAFPYAERQNQRLLQRCRQLPGWYPSLVHIFPMIVCRVLPVGGMYRPVTYCRTLGYEAGVDQPEVWMGGYEATLLMDSTGWPIFRVERIFIPPESELPSAEILELLLEDGMRIATGLGVRQFQVLHLELPEGRLPGFPVNGGPFGPLPDSGLGSRLAELGYSPKAEFGYYRKEATGIEGVPDNDHATGRTYRWGDEDLGRYLVLWTEHCSRHIEDYHFLAARLSPLDPHLQHHMEPGEHLSRIRFLNQAGSPAGLVSWYPDAYPVLLEGEASGPLIRLQLGELDPAAVTSAKVLKCFAPRAEPAEEEALLASGLQWAMQAAFTAHPRLKWVEAGPVAPTHQAMIAVLDRAGFSRFGRLVVMEKLLSRFED